MKAKFTLNAMSVVKGEKTLKFEGGTIEVEYAVGELAEIIKMKTEMLPAMKTFFAGMLKEATPFFEKVVDLESNRQKEIHALELRRMEMDEEDFKARNARQDAESAARVQDLEAQAAERTARTKNMRQA